MVITRTKTKAEGSVKYECPERNDSLGKETKQPNLQKEERSDKSLRVVVVTKRGWVVNQINQTYFLKGLRMKKSVCLMAILGAFIGGVAQAADSQSVIVKFKGQVASESCTVEILNSISGVVDLGTISKTAGKDTKGQLVPLTFKLTGCSSGLTDPAPLSASVDLTNDLMNSYPANTDPDSGRLSTDQEKLAVQIYTSDNGGTAGVKKDAVAIKKDGDTYLPVGWAALLKTGDGDLTAGGVEAKGMFTISYQ